MLLQQCIGFIKTPPLWIKEKFGLTQFEFPEMDLKEFVPEPIPDRIRLGHQMEYVFKQLIEYCPDYEVLLHNLPIRDEKQTIGEIDFILRETCTKELVHVELTYKFYIINPKISEPMHQLMGPNRRDMFFRKMEKIKNEQIPLLHSAPAVLTLKQIGLTSETISHQVCYKAQLFKPYASKINPVRPLNNNCIVGFWLKFEDFENLEFKDYTYYIPSKSEWVIAPQKDVVWSSHFEILTDINLRMLKENAPMVWMRKSETEYKKFFVVWW